MLIALIESFCPRYFGDGSALMKPPCSRGVGVVLLDKLGQISDNRRQVDGMATEMNLQSLIFLGFSGATRRIRTDDLLITNQLLYQLS